MGSGEEVNVTFTANLANDVMTRAFGEGKLASELYYSVFLGEQPITNFQGKKTTTDGTWTIDFTLVKGMKYKVALWAQAPSAPYEFNHSTGEVTYTTNAVLTSNNDALDAFYHVEEFTVAGQTEIAGIKLKRALAQINVGTNDLEAAKDAGVEPNSSNMKVTGAGSSFNVLTGKAASTTTIEFTAAEIDADKLLTFNIGGDPSKTYNYVARNYIFTVEDANVDIAFDINYKNSTEKVSYTVPNVPVKKNYKTNVYGSLLTNPLSLSVSIDAAFDKVDSDDIYRDIQTASSNTAASDIMTEAANASGNGTPASAAIDATQDVTEVPIPEAFVTSGTAADPSSVSTNYETAPASFTHSEADATSSSTPEFSKVKSAVTAKGETGTVDNYTPNTSVEYNTSDTWTIETMNAGTGKSTLTIGEGVTVKTLNLHYGNLVINGTVETINYSGEETIYYVLTGETVPKFAEGVEDKFVKLASAEELALRNAIANPSVTAYTLNADIESTLPFEVQSGDFTLNLNGHAIKVTGTGNDVFVNHGGNLTINGEGSVTSTGDNGYAVVARGGKTVLNGGTYKAEYTATSCIYAMNEAAVEINGGHFSVGGPHDGRYFVLNKKDNSKSTISVKGGEFENYNPAKSLTENPQENFVADGYISYQSSENVYTVVPATSELSVSTAAALNDIAEQGGKVKLNADLTLTSPVYVKGNLELDLNGKKIQAGNTWEGAGNNALLVVNYGGTLTLNGNGTISSNNNKNVWTAVAVTAYGESTDETNPATLVVNGNPAVTGYYYAVAGNGSRHNTDITINGGTYKGEVADDNTAIFHPQDGKLTIKGGNFEAYNAAVEMRAGTLDIAGGSFKATAPSLSTAANGSGTTIVGSAIAISQHTTNKKIVATVSGGTFEGAYALYEDDMQTEPTDVTITISGGTFEGNVDSKKAEFNITGGTFNNFVNGVSYVPVQKTYVINNANGLMWLSDLINGKVGCPSEKMVPNTTFKDCVVELGADIDLAGLSWTPIGAVTSYPSVTFSGTFDGKNHSVKNMTASVDAEGYACAGFFGSMTGVIRNLILYNANITSTHYAGGICAYSSANTGMQIDNCHVKNSTITSEIETLSTGGFDNGDKAGAIIGYMVAGDKVTNCTVENTTIQGYRDLGGIVGYSRGTVSNCKVLSGVKIIATYSEGQNYENFATEDAHDANSIVGDGTAEGSCEGTAEIIYNFPSAQ